MSVPARTEHLLPPSASDTERRLSAVLGRLSDVPAPIRDMHQPYATPAAFLPFLGWGWSVDLWDEEWSQARKRAMVDAAPLLHMRKGTAYVLREYARFVGAEITDILRPPKRQFVGAAMSREERAAWLESLPQVRTWRIREAGTRGYATFAGAAIFRSFLEGVFPVPSTAMQRLNRRARWVVDGTETDVRVSDFGGYFRLHRDGEAGLGTFCNRRPLRTFYLRSSAHDRLVTIRPTARLAWRFPIGPTIEPVTAEPERVVVEGTMQHGVFSGCGMATGYLRPSTAAYRIYWRFAAFERRSSANRRPSVSYMGVGRLGFPAHTAHLRVSIPGRRETWRAGEGIHLPGTRFWVPHDRRPVQNTYFALRAAKRASDLALVHFPLRHRMLAGRLFLADVDSFVIGRSS